MAEPRARPRNKGQVFNDADLRDILFSFGDTPHSLPATLLILDEILTDFIIETCHHAAQCASYSRRQKIKVDDFRFVLRHNPTLLGRVNEQLFREKWLKGQRKAVDLQGFAGGKVEELEGLAEIGGEGDEVKKKGRGRGRRKRKAEDEGGEMGREKRVAV